MLIDIFLILFAFAGFYLGYTKGIVRTLFSILGYIVALLLTLWLSPWFTDLLIKTFKIGKMFALIFGSLLFLIIMIFLIRWLLKSVDKYLQKSKLTTTSKIMGGVIMLGLGMVVFAFLMWTINQLGLIGEQTKQSSLSFHTLESVPRKAGAFIEEFKPLFRRYWELMHETIQESKSKPEG